MAGADERVLILMATTRDGVRSRDVLMRAGIACVVCKDMTELCLAIIDGAGAALLTQEMLVRDRQAKLAETLRLQDTWSDFPVIVLTHQGDSGQLGLREAANVTLVERPVRMGPLLSVVRSALRARRHQYAIRDALAERIRQAHALSSSEERYRTLISHVKDYAIFSTDPEGRADSWNEGVQRVLGFAEPEFIGVDILPTIFTPEDFLAGVPQNELREAARSGSADNDRWMRRKDGTRFWASGVTTSRRDAEGKLVGFTKVMRDHTDWKLADMALREAARRKDEFMAMLAHELRNPLAPIRNSLHLLGLRGGDAAIVEQVRSMMERQVYHLSRLVDDLLDVSRIAMGKVQLRRSRVDLSRITLQSVQAHRPAFNSKRIKLHLDVPDTPVWVMGDVTRLAQIVDNLLANAMKFTAEQGEVAASVAADGPNHRAILSVRDTGVGIESGMLQRLFEPFAQADRTLDRSQGGLGLGLAIVKGLAELHNGTMQAESGGLGLGATFTLILPSQEEPAALTEVTERLPLTGVKHLRVLVVEDNRDAADSLRLLLQVVGYQVTVAYSGPDGVRAAEEQPPDVVICDIGLPGMDGYGVAAALRQNPATGSARLIALTGYGQEEDRRRAFEAGFDDHLTKPADPVALQAVIAGQHRSP